MDDIAQQITKELERLNERRAQLMGALTALGMAAERTERAPRPQKSYRRTVGQTARDLVRGVFSESAGPLVYTDVRAKLPEMPVGTISGSMHHLMKHGELVWVDTDSHGRGGYVLASHPLAASAAEPVSA